MPTTQSPQPPPWGSPRPGSPPPRPPATPEQVRDRLRLFLLMLLGLVIVVQLPLPFRLAGLVLVVGLGWVGIRLLFAMSALQRAGKEARGRLSVTIGLGLATLMLVTLTADVVYYPLSAGLERCLSRANTLTAQETCESEQRRRVEELNEELRRRAGLR